MTPKYKTSWRMYSAWNYEKEIEDLNRASDQGWQLVKGGCFHSRFVRNPDIRYRYQLDYTKPEEMGRYIELFREQGWEYVNSTFNGWHYFRKLYDPSLPEEEYEIFTDRESLLEMNGRWARLALILGIFLAVMALVCAVRAILRPHLPVLVQLLTFAVEAAVLLRGAAIMRSPDASRKRRGDSAFLTVFILVILLGCIGSSILGGMRPRFQTQQQADSVSEPVTDNRWMDFDIPYPDFYYLDLEADSEQPLSFAILNEAGEEVYSAAGTSIQEEGVRIRLPRGHYTFSMSCESGYSILCYLE